eukprot:3238655-Rhodomonas_salina.4
MSGIGTIRDVSYWVHESQAPHAASVLRDVRTENLGSYATSVPGNNQYTPRQYWGSRWAAPSVL